MKVKPVAKVVPLKKMETTQELYSCYHPNHLVNYKLMEPLGLQEFENQPVITGIDGSNLDKETIPPTKDR